MSGQPNINPSDQTKFRQQYLANLNLRARLDDVNLQANKVYTRTGQLPIEPSDFRTTEEKLADVGRLRIEVRSKLSEITDGREANKISQELNSKQLLFYTQMSEAINKELKPKYRLGIYADIFIPYLQNYMNNTANVNGIKDGLQQTSGRDVDLNGKDILKTLPLQNEIRVAINDILGHTKGSYVKGGDEKKLARSNWGQQGEILKETAHTLGRLLGAIHTFYTTSSVRTNANADDETEAYKIVNAIAGNVITKVQLYRWLDTVMRAFKGGDLGLVDFYIGKGIELMTVPEDSMELMRTAQQLNPLLARKTSGGDDITAPELFGETVGPSNIKKFRHRDLLQYIKANGIRIPAEAKRTKQATMDALMRFWLDSGRIHKEAREGMSKEDSSDESPDEFTPVRHTPKKISDYYKDTGTKGKGMRGRGLNRRPDHLTVMDTDWTNGILPTKRFIPIGRYIINKHRLDKDIVAIKRPAGSTIKSLPSEKVSRKLGHIIREIVGGGMPEYEDLEQLNDQEKAYLNKIATETNIIDRLSIPAPKKSEIDKETNEYEIMRGEIMSGNDNKDLVKKFKIVLLKLMNKGVIPKGQAKEILLELTSMGF